MCCVNKITNRKIYFLGIYLQLQKHRNFKKNMLCKYILEKNLSKASQMITIQKSIKFF